MKINYEIAIKKLIALGCIAYTTLNLTPKLIDKVGRSYYGMDYMVNVSRGWTGTADHKKVPITYLSINSLGNQTDIPSIREGDKPYSRLIEGRVLVTYLDNTRRVKDGKDFGDLITEVNGKDLRVYDPGYSMFTKTENIK